MNLTDHGSNHDFEHDDPIYRRKWIRERAEYLEEDEGYSKATAYIKATREYNDEMGLN